MTFNIGDLIVNSYVSGMGGYETPGERYVYVVRGSRWSEFEEKVLKIKLCPVRSDLQSFYTVSYTHLTLPTIYSV